MDKFLTIMHILVNATVWSVAVFFFGVGIIMFSSTVPGVFFKFILPTSLVIGGVLFAIVGTKLNNWIFNKDHPD